MMRLRMLNKFSSAACTAGLGPNMIYNSNNWISCELLGHTSSQVLCVTYQQSGPVGEAVDWGWITESFSLGEFKWAEWMSVCRKQQGVRGTARRSYGTRVPPPLSVCRSEPEALGTARDGCSIEKLCGAGAFSLMLEEHRLAEQTPATPAVYRLLWRCYYFLVCLVVSTFFQTSSMVCHASVFYYHCLFCSEKNTASQAVNQMLHKWDP